MKQLDNALASHLSQEITSLATCWKLTRRDGMVMGFTDNDNDITISGINYISSSGFTPSAISSSAALNIDDLDIEGILDNSAITQEDLISGIYDHAEIQVFQVNYQQPDDGILTQRTGWLGEVSCNSGRFIAEVQGLTQRLQQYIGDLFSPTCRANFTDSKCGLDESSYIVSGTVTSTSSHTDFTDTSRSETSGIFAHGNVTFTSGANIGLTMEVKESNLNDIRLMLPMPNSIAIGDNYDIIQGCDKRFSTCTQSFNNAVNFRGEPNIPGMDRILETSATRTSW